jgi:hypothetical protein
VSKRESFPRHNCVSVMGFDPYTGEDREFWIEKDLIQHFYKISKLDKFKELYCVTEIASARSSVIFKGLEREGHEESLCYVGLASCAYTRDGHQRTPRPRETFAVFILKNDKIFRWGWEAAADNLVYPLGYETRFGPRIWPKA